MIDTSEPLAKKYSVYCHTNKTNGKRYVGITSRNPEKRWREGRDYKHNAHFTSSIQKYGWDGFDHDVIISDIDEEYAKSFEKMLINLYHSTDRRCGYNKSTGGESGNGVRHSLKSRRLMSEKAKGRVLSKETRAKISEALKNRDESLKYKFAHSHDGKPSWNKGICGKDSHSYGVVFSDERKRHLSEALKGKPKSAEHKKHLSKKVRHLLSGEVYDSITEAERKTGASHTTIINHCKGLSKKPMWEYVKGEQK